MKQIWVLLVTLSLFSHVLAGDPGPIDLTVYNVTPSWRNAQEDIATLESKLFRAGIGYNDRSGSVVISTIFKGSAASKSGLTVGDTLLAVNDMVVKTESDVSKAFDVIRVAPINLQVKRSSDTLTITVHRSMGDPLFYNLLYWAKEEYNAIIRYGSVTDGDQALIEEKAFTSSKGFRTDDAHKRLKGHFPEGTLLMIRGGKRILFVLPGWSTVCVKVPDYDGALLTDAKLEKLWTRIVGKYDNWRYANP